jgi:hypothetical protein
LINPTTETVITQVAAPATGQISNGPDGALWFTESGALGRITTAAPHTITTVSTPNTNPSAVANGPDGNLWFGGQGTSTIPNVTGTVDLSSASTATQLAITTQPSAHATASKGFGLVVAVENASSGVDTYFNGTVTIILGANPGGSTLSGTMSATAVNGVATFPGLSLNLAGSGYTIIASSTGLPSVTSSPITVSQAATHLVITSQPPRRVGFLRDRRRRGRLGQHRYVFRRYPYLGPGQ